MANLLVISPIFAVLLSASLAVLGASTLIVLCSLILAAPAFALLAFFICTTVHPCTPQLRDEGVPEEEVRKAG
jgi:hypothetical protein